MLGSEGFYMNTHPGFALAMMQIPYVTRPQRDGIMAFAAACTEYAEDRRDLPEVGDFLPDCPKLIERECSTLQADAIMTRMEAQSAGSVGSL